MQSEAVDFVQSASRGSRYHAQFTCSLNWEKYEGNKKLMVLHVRPTPTRFLTNILQIPCILYHVYKARGGGMRVPCLMTMLNIGLADFKYGSNPVILGLYREFFYNDNLVNCDSLIWQLHLVFPMRKLAWDTCTCIACLVNQYFKLSLYERSAI